MAYVRDPSAAPTYRSTQTLLPSYNDVNRSAPPPPYTAVADVEAQRSTTTISVPAPAFVRVMHGSAPSNGATATTLTSRLMQMRPTRQGGRRLAQFNERGRWVPVMIYGTPVVCLLILVYYLVTWSEHDSKSHVA